MNVEELFAEVATHDSHLAHLQQADNPEYEVVADEGEDTGGPRTIKGVRWDHQAKQMVIELA